MSTERSDGPVTLITGGGTGIGAAATRRLLARGHRVAVTGRRKERLEEFATEAGAGPDLLTLPGDSADPGAVRAAVEAAVREFGRLDAVVANAGLSTHDTLESGDPEQWRDMLNVNVLGPAVLIKEALPALKESKGRIVLVGSTAGVKNTPGNMYSVTKWAVSALAENARVLVTGSGVGVTMVAPGRVETPFWDSREGGIPDGPFMTADTVAAAIEYALSQPAGVEINSVVVRPTGQVH
ncbi:SDR family NAD(P)-dependent oxidoreductase [Actinomadura barringtoniae]|uniref:SDR family NAD(P)-dependent oxidoreductase n=1 Tax=Actinomadura barringtoniae TaxID=1427535 RepID=A0A939PEC1_9ACTN|nr:SDR family NAD(P)-dependent oxidoreductase [Actinomadura barringtoniae]MBO2451031.1 SDR family NAD(P)-dependent oxidoreductase [Actinomadura barringtoniae]